MSVHEILLFIPAAFLMAVPFGPSNFLVFTNGLRHGSAPAGAAGFARITAFALLIVITAIGLGAALAEAAWLLLAIKWFGICYLAYLGLRIWRSPPPDLAAARALGRSSRSVSVWALARMEFTTALANPKAILYFTAAFPQFIGHAENFIERFLTMGGVFLVCEYLVLWGYALAGGGLGRAGWLDGVQGWINRITGASFIGFAGWMASRG
ncbi:MAG: LysE family translocator [Rhodospirillum sp.]|nr:LysE family translocator [Rhodospirillum sp.]MCF8491598.1 LysE family translocator [Rhodospirillum sp.]MCF8499507.1 LysE family translocator [Rhodospirillum sp.]